MATRRRQRYRVKIFNELVDIIENEWGKKVDEDDLSIWKQTEDKYKPVFRTKTTWELLRQQAPTVSWWKGVWFKHHTPKYDFFHWIVIQNRLATWDRMSFWNRGINPSCVLCHAPQETRDHFFFGCLLMRGFLQSTYTNKWSELTSMILDNSGGFLRNFLVPYTLQATVHALWERNERRHGAIARLARDIGKSSGSSSKEPMSFFTPTRRA